MNPFINLSDEKLMELYQSGEYLAFEVIYERYQRKVYGYLQKRLKQSEAVGEVFQNTFLKLHKSRMKYDSRYLLVKWIYTLCRSELLDYIKAKNIKPLDLKPEMDLYIDQTKGEEAKIDSNEKAAELINETSTLSPAEKTALEMRFLFDLDYEDISKRLATSSANSRKLVSRGVAKLRSFTKKTVKSG